MLSGEGTVITAYTDGGALDNPGGWSAWSCLLIAEDGTEFLCSGLLPPPTSSNAAELEAAIQALQRTAEGIRVHLISDSSYLVNTMKKGWRRKANHGYWQRLDALCDARKVTWEHVPGHNGLRGNELVDRGCRAELDKVRGKK